MKKVIGLFLAALVLMLGLTGCQTVKGKTVDENATLVETSLDENNLQESLTETLIHEIDDAYLEKLNLPEFSTTAKMVELADMYTKEWEQVADEYYGKIMEYDGIIQANDNSYSSDDLHAFVSNMKANWEQYNQQQCENYLETMQTIYGSGTMGGLSFANFKYDMQKDWALQLVGIYQELYIA